MVKLGIREDCREEEKLKSNKVEHANVWMEERFEEGIGADKRSRKSGVRFTTAQ